MKRLIPLLILILTNCASPLAPWEPDGDRSERVVVFGDSLSWGARYLTTSLYVNRGDVSLSFNSYPGTEIPSWYQGMENVPIGSTVVVALGTNDLAHVGLSDIQLTTLYALDRLRNAGAGRVVWLTVSTLSAAQLDLNRWGRTQDYDQWLRSIADDWLVIEDWDRISADHPEWLGDDHVHHTAAGQQAYAETLYEAGTWLGDAVPSMDIMGDV